jgi:hypothetical protein
VTGLNRQTEKNLFEMVTQGRFAQRRNDARTNRWAGGRNTVGVEVAKGINHAVKVFCFVAGGSRVAGEKCPSPRPSSSSSIPGRGGRNGGARRVGWFGRLRCECVSLCWRIGRMYGMDVSAWRFRLRRWQIGNTGDYLKNMKYLILVMLIVDLTPSVRVALVPLWPENRMRQDTAKVEMHDQARPKSTMATAKYIMEASKYSTSELANSVWLRAFCRR